MLLTLENGAQKQKVLAFLVSNPFKFSFLLSDKFRKEVVVVNCVLCGLAVNFSFSQKSPLSKEWLSSSECTKN
jgi:hypothetical protein